MTTIKAKHKLLSIVMAVTLLFGIMLPMGAEPVMAYSSQAAAVVNAVDSGSVTIEGKAYPVETISTNITDLQTVLTSIASKDQSKLYRVVLASGTYTPSATVKISSNTILDLRNNVTLYGTTIRTANLDTVTSGYDGVKNIMILGGSIHELAYGVSAASHKISGAKSTCTVRFGHAKNVNIIGSKFYDNCGGHHVELGGVKNILISDCEFTGYADPDPLGNQSSSLEAIQLDVIHREAFNFEKYNNKDDSSVEDATIINNYFHDLRRGVGSHHAVYNHPYKNINISGNTFKNIVDKAIQLEYCQGASISYNTLDNVTCGISVNSAFAGSFYLPNNASERNSLSINKEINANTVVANNTIRLNTSNVANEKWADNSKYGIRVFGESITASNNKKGYEASTATLPPNGEYYISNVTVKDNTVTTVNNAGTNNIESAIRLRLAKNCSVTGNVINSAASSSVKQGSCISLLNTSGCLVAYNNVTKGFNGIAINNGSYDRVEDNTVYGCYKNGITILGSVTQNINSNKVYDNPENAIAVSNSSTANNINYNSIWGNFTQGISVSGSSKAGTIYSNTISGAKKNGISVTTSSRVNNAISSNKINSSGTNGIIIYSKAYAKKIEKNNINKAKSMGILVYSSSTVNAISSNTIKSAKKFGICLSEKAKCKSFVANKLKSCGKKNTVSVSANSKGIVLNKNTLTVKKKKKTATLKITGKAKNKKKITWKSSNKKVATVKGGKITLKKKGTTTITVTQNGVSAKCKVTVK